MKKGIKIIGGTIGIAIVASNLISVGTAAREYYVRHPNWAPTKLFDKYLKLMCDTMIELIDNLETRTKEPSE